MSPICAFVDESWVTTSSDGKSFLAVASVVTANRRRLELLARKIRRIRKLRAHSELKASLTPPDHVERFLREFASDPGDSVVAAIWRGKRGAVEDYEALYQQVVARCALQTVRQHKRIDLILDKRYTNREQQIELEGAIREALAVVPGNVVRIFQEDSHAVQELTAPDFVAWAFAQRYCRDTGRFYDLIRSRMAHLDDLSKRKATLPRHR